MTLANMPVRNHQPHRLLHIMRRHSTLASDTAIDTTVTTAHDGKPDYSTAGTDRNSTRQ
ncbi:hypothetical protein CCHOA_09750 [Corynebacterium choanae]|uniref:Uncharacterized protein n=1 Tax=Corynebacterium choanae TaxID=1862358 RepID=A0A3G6J989_9CORY|nr:hypothetical protein CCHOA_09750 [Corynebacterium choanae]